MPKKTKKIILVTGATGQQGGAVLRHLRKADFPVRVLTRDPEKPSARALVGHGAEVVKGDLEDPASVARAIEDVDGVYSVQDWSGGAETEIRQGINLADAANRAAVSYFVYSSVAAADKDTKIPHFESKFRIEEHIRGLGLPYTIFRPVFFMENWLGMKEQIESGTLALPLSPDKLLQMIATDDIGAFVAAAFEHPGKWLGKAVEIAGDDLSLSWIAQTFSTNEGREVKYQQVAWDRFEQHVGQEMTAMYRWFEDVGYQVDIDALRQVLPNLTSFDRWINTKWEPNVAEPGHGATA